MATDLLRATANERVDLVDFEFLADSGLQANLRHLNAQFLTDPGGQRSWILDGFVATNPVGQQVQVAKGRGILGQREGAVVHYGALAVEGDATKIIDMSTLSPNANYGVYVRFEYVDGDTGSRIFWNPAGTGSELAQTVATRRKANWSLRIELSNPGGEWVKIASADNTGIGAVLTDERPFYFEGDPNASYQSGWSSDGGGGANDRNADRQQYGVKDMQAFTAAMRQSLEDIRGRGLRRWWDRDIGGMNIGFDAAPVEDRVAIGDADFYLDQAGSPLISFDAAGQDRIEYDRGTNEWRFIVGGTYEAVVADNGLRVINGIHVGSNTTPRDNDIVIDGGLAVGVNLDPDDDQVVIGDTNFRIDFDGTDPYLVFDDWAGTKDGFKYDRSANEFQMIVAGAEEYGFSTTTFDVHSNNITNVGNLDGTGDVTMGTITMTGFSVDADGDTSVKSLNVNSGGITNAGAISGATTIGASGAISGASLNVGSGGITCGQVSASGDLLTTAGLRVGSGATNPAAGEGIFSDGLTVGYDGAAGTDEVRVGDANCRVAYNSGNPRFMGDSDLWLEFNRAANSATLSLGGTNYLFDGDKIDLGGSTSYKAPGSASQLAARNNIRAIARWSSSATLDTASDWNITSVTSPGTGQYHIQTSGLSYLGDCVCIGHIQGTATNLKRICWTQQVSLGGFDTRIRVTCWSITLDANVNEDACVIWVGRSG